MSKTEDPPSTDESIDHDYNQSNAEDYDHRPVIRYRRLTSFQQTILQFVAKLGSPYGLAIKRELEDHYEKEINHGRLYPNLNTLAEKGFIEKSHRDDRTNDYELTETGERVVCAEVEAAAERVTEA
jgi:DNA-binding PadR family transcriptional regulator